MGRRCQVGAEHIVLDEIVNVSVCHDGRSHARAAVRSFENLQLPAERGNGAVSFTAEQDSSKLGAKNRKKKKKKAPQHRNLTREDEEQFGQGEQKLENQSPNKNKKKNTPEARGTARNLFLSSRSKAQRERAEVCGGV